MFFNPICYRIRKSNFTTIAQQCQIKTCRWRHGHSGKHWKCCQGAFQDNFEQFRAQEFISESFLWNFIFFVRRENDFSVLCRIWVGSCQRNWIKCPLPKIGMSYTSYSIIFGPLRAINDSALVWYFQTLAGDHPVWYDAMYCLIPEIFKYFHCCCYWYMEIFEHL